MKLNDKRKIKVNTKLPQYIPIPYSVISMEMSQTAKLVYGMILGRATLSQKNNMVEENGDIYVIYAVKKLADDLNRSEVSIRSAMNELVANGLLVKKQMGYHRANMLYVLLPQENDAQGERNLTKENLFLDHKKTYPKSVRKFSPKLYLFLCNN